uniref:Uncharacterized protein n=1 Tax=Romanomermis culicivorax TaxID=13658 RepID=A0A915JX99_ROMCU
MENEKNKEIMIRFDKTPWEMNINLNYTRRCDPVYITVIQSSVLICIRITVPTDRENFKATSYNETNGRPFSVNQFAIFLCIYCVLVYPTALNM